MPSAKTQSSFRDRIMPVETTRYTRVITWLNVITNIGIVGTGGLVRLTGSGLGCSEWPYCTPESIFPTPELGIHGMIEFGNRTLTFVLVVVALLAFLAVVRTPKQLALRRIPLWIGVLIIVQAVVGGITVWLELDPRIVGVHFLISALLAALAGLQLARVQRVHELPANLAITRDRGVWFVALLVTVLCWFTELVGVLTTGSGPHAGDELAARNGLDPVIMHHVHAWPGYALLISIVVLRILVARAKLDASQKLTDTLAVFVMMQIGFGIYQARTGLPIWSVAVHMVLAVTVLAMLSVLLVNLRRELSRPTEVAE